MKARFIHIATAVAGAALFAGCSGDLLDVGQADRGAENNGAGNSTSVTLVAGIESTPQTRTDITDPLKPIWSQGDAVGLHFASESGMVVTNQRIPGSFDRKFEKATFSGQIAGLTSGDQYTIYGYYPHGEFGNLTYSPDGGRILVPAVQRPKATSFDPAADIMVLKPVKFTHDGGTVYRDDLRFTRVLATLRIKLNVPALNGEPVEKLTVTVNDPDIQLSGRGLFDLTKGEFTQFYYDGSSTVTAEPQDDILANSADVIHLCVPAVTIPAGTTITFSGKTDTYKFTKTVTVPAGGIDLSPSTFFDMGVSDTDMDVEDILAYDETLNNEWIYDNDGARELLDAKEKITHVVFDAYAGLDRTGLIVTLSDKAPTFGIYDNFIRPFIPGSKLGQEVELVPNDVDVWRFIFELYEDRIAYTGSGTESTAFRGGKMLVTRDGNNINCKLSVRFADGTVLKAHYSGAAIDANPPAEDVIPGPNQMAYTGKLTDLKNVIYLSNREDEGLMGFAIIDELKIGMTDQKEEQVEIYLPFEKVDSGEVDLMALDETTWSVKYYSTYVNYFLKSPDRSDPGGSMSSGEVTIGFDTDTGNISIVAHFVYGTVAHMRINYNGPLEGLD